MQITLDTGPGHQINQVEPGLIRIGDKVFHQSLVVSPNQITPCTLEQVQDITPELCNLMLKDQPEVVILGTGEKQQFPPINIMQCFIAQQIGVEVMNTNAACRTYNVLMSESRRVVALLIL